MMQSVLPDGLLAVLIAVVATRMVLIRNFRNASGLFFIFCILMAAAWVRLQLPWLGAAEVAIGALMTGFAVRHALDLLPGFPGPDVDSRGPMDSRPAGMAVSLAGSAAFMGILFAVAMLISQDVVLTTDVWYAASAIPAAVAGFFSLSRHRHLLHRALAFNVLGSGVFLLIVCFASNRSMSMDVPFFMVTSGLLVAFFATLMVVIVLGRKPGRGGADSSGEKEMHVR